MLYIGGYVERFLNFLTTLLTPYVISSFGRKTRRKRPLGIQKRRWEDDIKMDLREIGGGGMDWIHFSQDRDQWRALLN
jgi:hypothetical protein